MINKLVFNDYLVQFFVYLFTNRKGLNIVLHYRVQSYQRFSGHQLEDSKPKAQRPQIHHIDKSKNVLITTICMLYFKINIK